MKSIVRGANEAHKRRELFVELHQKSRLLELKLIWEIWKNKDHKSLGFDSFKDYCEAPINSGGINISRVWALQLAEVYEIFVNKFKIDENMLLQATPRKLYSLRRKVNKENLEEIIEMAKNLTLEDIEKDLKNIDEMTCEHDWTDYKFCKLCRSWKK